MGVRARGVWLGEAESVVRLHVHTSFASVDVPSIRLDKSDLLPNQGSLPNP